MTRIYKFRPDPFAVFAILMLVGAILPGPLPAQQPALPAGYQWIPVTTGVFLVTQERPVDGAADGNSVIIINERDVVVVDTHMLPRVTRAVVARIRQHTANPVRYVINTHWHDDHNNGNQVYREAFPGVDFVAQEATATALREKGEPFLRQRVANYKEILRRLQDGSFRWEDPSLPPAAARRRQVFKAYVEAFLPDLDVLRFTPPTMTFVDSIILHRPGREIRILYLGRGNTKGDAVIYLPQDRILITGDLVVHPIPFAFDVFFEEWIDVLGKLTGFEANVIIPGHGGVLHQQAYLRQLQELLRFTLEQSRQAVEAGRTREDILEDEVWGPWEERFAGSDPQLRWAFRNYFLQPALERTFKDLQGNKGN